MDSSILTSCRPATEKWHAANYNKDHSPGSAVDNRSDNKGPEPEAVATGVVGGATYSFVGAERGPMS